MGWAVWFPSVGFHHLDWWSACYSVVLFSCTLHHHLLSVRRSSRTSRGGSRPKSKTFCSRWKKGWRQPTHTIAPPTLAGQVRVRVRVCVVRLIHSPVTKCTAWVWNFLLLGNGKVLYPSSCLHRWDALEFHFQRNSAWKSELYYVVRPIFVTLFDKTCNCENTS